eukprot:9092944-Alexandrium_andersonii.AAC.1
MATGVPPPPRAKLCLRPRLAVRAVSFDVWCWTRGARARMKGTQWCTALRAHRARLLHCRVAGACLRAFLPRIFVAWAIVRCCSLSCLNTWCRAGDSLASCAFCLACLSTCRVDGGVQHGA